MEVPQSVPHALRHWALLILWTMLKVSQQKNLKEQSETARLLHLVSGGFHIFISFLFHIPNKELRHFIQNPSK